MNMYVCSFGWPVVSRTKDEMKQKKEAETSYQVHISNSILNFSYERQREVCWHSAAEEYGLISSL